MIEKKIKYDINIEKPSKTKPVKQGGVFNYLGKQKTVNAPVKWRSSKDHPIAHLSYITKDEQKILIDLNLYGSLKGKPNRGPFGLPSLQGSGGGSGGDGDGSSGGDSSSSGEGDSTGDAGDQGGTAGPGGPGDSGPGGSDDGTGHGGPGPGPGDTSGSSTAQDAAANQAASEAANQAATDAATIGMQEDPAEETALEAAVTAVQTAIQNQVQKALDNPVQTALGIAHPALGLAYGFAKDAYSSYARGVTAPDDFSQLDTSVQTGPAQSPGNGGIVDLYAPLNNSSTGNPTMDAYIRQLRINLGLPV